MEFVLKNFADWQLIITLHDRVWFEQLRGLFRRFGHEFTEHRLLRWTFLEGPALAALDIDPTAPLRRGMDSGDSSTTCAVAGRLLEQIASNLSWRLHISVQRTPDDKYTLADLWPGVVKALKKTNAKPCTEAIDRRVDLRNLVGAHYNEWADALPWTDAEAFGHAVIALWEAVHCPQCQDFVALEGRELIVCRCRALAISAT